MDDFILKARSCLACSARTVEGIAHALEGIRALEQRETSDIPHGLVKGNVRVTEIGVYDDDAANEFAFDAAKDGGDQVMAAFSTRVCCFAVVCAAPRAYHVVPWVPTMRLPRKLAEHHRRVATPKTSSLFAESDE